MIEIKGKYTQAKILTDNVEQEAITQIYEVCNHPAFEDSNIAIMPDVHAGKGCVIGFTATIEDKIIPNLLGVDLGCGMLTVDLGDKELDLKSLDIFIRNNIPYGSAVNKIADLTAHEKAMIDKVCKKIGSDKNEYFYKSVGSLGSGNHFLELARGDIYKNNFLIIHSGSRNFGHSIASYYQKLASTKCKEVGISKDLMYLEGEDMTEYLYCANIANWFAQRNREFIANKILKFLDRDSLRTNGFHTVHNYYDKDFGIIRKGAISANFGERVLIPINMRDGSILAKGKITGGEYNYSAPHGAGRIMSRSKAKQLLNLEEFSSSMEGIYTTSVSVNTLDEAPQAYKPIQEILDNIGDLVDVEDILKPIYNFKG